MVKTPPQKIAVLIDADNLQSDLLDNMLKAVEKHGKPMIRRAYGDWTNEQLDRWHLPAKNNSFELVQVTQYSINKNATDIGLVIDAMDIMFQGAMDGFCIISNDSDFTSLCTRLRNAGLFVMGIGGEHASPTLRKACEEWVFIKDIKPSNYKKRRNTSFRPRRRRKNTSRPNPFITKETTNDGNNQEQTQSRWSLLTTSLPFFNRQTKNNDKLTVKLSDTTSNNDSPATASLDWRSRINQSSPLLNADKPTLPSPKSNNNGNTLSARFGGSTRIRSVAPKNGKDDTAPPTPKNDKPQTKSMPSTQESPAPKQEQPVVTVKTEATKSGDAQKATIEDIRKDAKKTKPKQQRLDEIKTWKPLIQELSDAYIRNLLLASYYIAQSDNEWVSLDKLNSNIMLLSPTFKYKALGYSKLINLINKYPQLLTVHKDGKKGNTKYYIKLVQPKL